jgi:surface polysaccharide O-acyltransferase-like enzyme
MHMRLCSRVKTEYFRCWFAGTLNSLVLRLAVSVEAYVLMHEQGVLIIVSTVTHCMYISHSITDQLIAATGRSISNGSTEKRRSPGILVEIVTDRRTL